MAIGGYKIRIRKVGYNWGPWIDVGNVTDYQFTDLEPDTIYFVQTQAYCETGSLSGTDEYSFRTPPTPDVEPVAHRVYLGRWSGPTNNSPFTNEFGPLSRKSERFIWQAGDIKVTVVATTGTTAEVTTPSGYVHAPGSPFMNTAGTQKISVLWKRIGENEPLSTLNVSNPTSWAMFYNVRGAIETGDPWLDTATVEGTGTGISFPSVATEPGAMMLFAANADAVLPTEITTTSNHAYNWQNDNLKEITGIDGSDVSFETLGHIGAIAISDVTGESGVTTCELHQSMSFAGWVGAIKPAATLKPRAVSINNPSSGNVTGFGRDLEFYPSVHSEESNYIFAFFETSDAVTMDSQWTEAPNSPVINSGGTNPTRLSVFYKKVVPDMDVDVAFNRMGSAFSCGTVVLRGAISTGNPFESISTSTGSGTSITIPGGTSTINNSLILQAVGRAVSTNNTASYSAWANADLTSVTERIDAGTSTGDDAGIGVVSGIKATAGAYGDTTATLINSTNWVTWQGVVKPEGASVPTVVTTNTNSTSSYPASGLFGSTGILEGDLIIAFCASDRQAPDRIVYGEEYGWTFLPETISTSGVGVSVAYKRASGIEPFMRFTSTNDHRCVTFAVFNNLDPDNPIVSTASNTGVGTAASVAGGTTDEDNTLVIHAMALGSISSSSQGVSGWTNSDLSGMSRGVEAISIFGNTGYVDSAYAYKDTAGTFGPTTATVGVSDAWAMWRAVLKTKP